jgi:hypothetical protein
VYEPPEQIAANFGELEDVRVSHFAAEEATQQIGASEDVQLVPAQYVEEAPRINLPCLYAGVLQTSSNVGELVVVKVSHLAFA